MVLNKISGLIKMIHNSLPNNKKKEIVDKVTDNGNESADSINMQVMSDEQLVYLLEQRVAQELFKPQDKSYTMMRYIIDLIEVITEEEEEEE